MKTTTLGQLFSPDQLRQAAAMMRNCPTPHEDLVQMLKMTGWSNPDVLVEYAAYVLEWQKDAICKAHE